MARFTNASEAHEAGYLYATVKMTGEGAGFYKTKEGADRAAKGTTYTVLKTEYMDSE